MAEANVAVASQPVVATPGGQQGKAELPFKVPAQGPKAGSRAEATLAGFSINDPGSDGIQDTSFDDTIVDKAQAAAGAPAKEAPRAKPANNEPPQDDAEAESRESKEASKRERLKVGEEEYELDQDQIRRFAQKGIALEKKNRAFEADRQQLAERQRQLAAVEQQTLQTYEALKDPNNIFRVIEQLHGPKVAREATEGYLRPLIEREMMPPEQQQALTQQEENARLRQENEAFKARDHQAQVDARAQELQGHYQQQIVQGLEKLELPVGADYTFLANEMASWMQRGIDNKTDYTPEQLASLVKEDNNLRVGLLVKHDAQRILEAKKAGNLDAVVKYGEALVEKLGEPVMYAIAKYHLAKHSRAQGLPQQEILSTAKVKIEEPPPRKGYMSEDEARAERLRRVAMMEKGIDPGEWK
jgi:hypothetical protein